MTNRRRLTAWLLAGLVLFVTLVSGFEIACEAHHVCVGADCRICAHIMTVRVLLRSISLAVVLASAAAAIRLASAAAPEPTRRVSACSPVGLRVKLLN